MSNIDRHREELKQLLHKDRSLYTSFLPRDIINLISNYIIERAYVYGKNSRGKLGIGSDVDPYLPVELSLNVKDLAFGADHTLLLTHDGELYISGSNYHQEFGITQDENEYLENEYPTKFGRKTIRNIMRGDIIVYNSYEFINISELKADQLQGQKIIKIAAGSYFSLVLTDQNRCFYFGHQKFLYNEALKGGFDVYSKNSWNLIAENVIDISCGYDHAGYITTDYQVYLFGDNRHGQLGYGEFKFTSRVRPLPNVSNVVRIFASANKTAFIIFNEGQYQLYITELYMSGVKSMTNRPKSILKLFVDEFNKPILNVKKVCFGDSHTLILGNGIVYLMGSNDNGQLGMGDAKNIDMATIIDQNITDIAAGPTSSFLVINKTSYFSGKLDNKQKLQSDRFIPLPYSLRDTSNVIDNLSIRAGYNSVGFLVV